MLITGILIFLINETLDFTNDLQFIGYLRNYQIMKKPSFLCKIVKTCINHQLIVQFLYSLITLRNKEIVH